MAKKENTSKKTKETILKVIPNMENINTSVITTNAVGNTPPIEEILFNIDNKLSQIIEKQNTPVNDITKMSLTDLKFIKETLTENIRIHNCASGDKAIVNSSYVLINKIMSELNNRIELCQ